MHPLLAALIPTLLLGFCILFLIIRLRNKNKILAELEKKLQAPAPKIIRRSDTVPPVPTPKHEEEPAAPESKAAKETRSKASEETTYFDASDSLLATLSHELKTPLNGIMGMAQVLMEENEDSSLLLELEGCAQHMHSVLHTLTNLARIQNENEYLPQYREWVSLRDTVEQIREDATFRASTRQLKILTEHENNRVRLRGDSDHIETIIKSIVLASIEAVPLVKLPKEKEALKISWKTDGDAIVLSITNPLEALEDEREESVKRILNLARGSQSSRIKIEYLHLAVARALLHFYKGSMDSKKLESGGVKTTIRFHMEQMVSSPSDAKPIGGLRVQSGKIGIKTLRELPEKLRVLVAEDDYASRNLLIMLLNKMELEPVAVENGEQAILALQEDPDFDVILMDVDMPIMDGIEATQSIRGGIAGDEVKDIPIVAVTAFNVISDRSRFKEAGMGYYLPKPVGLKELRATLLDIAKAKKTQTG
jgi:CheY-like chemotaxis protein